MKMNMALSRWGEFEIPAWDGIVHSSGDAFRIEDGCLSRGDLPLKVDFMDAGVLASLDLFGDQYRVRCGESCSHGSIGFVVFENAQTGAAVWSFASFESNPFDQIEVKGSYVLVLSTSGTVFRFREELEDVGLFIP